MDKIANDFKYEIINLRNYVLNNKKLIIVIVFFCILSFGFALSNFTIGVDSEYEISKQVGNNKEWIKQGRFGVALLKVIFSTDLISPFRNTYLTISLMIINTLLLCYVLGYKNKQKLNVIISIIYITSPIFVHNLYFMTYNFEVQMGILLCILACYISSKYILSDNKIISLLAIMFLSFSIGIYQSFISFYIALICYKIFDYIIKQKEEIKFKEFSKICFCYSTLIIMSVSVYYIIDKLTSLFIPKSGNYTDGFLGWQRYEMSVVLEKIKLYIESILIDNVIIGTNVIFYTFIISICLVIYYLFKRNFKVPILIFMIMLSPFILTIALGSEMPYRSQQTLILIIPLIFAILYQTVNNKYFRNIMIIIAVYIGFNQSMYANKLLYSDYARYQQDLDLSRQIVNKINELGYNDKKYKLICLGKRETVQTPNIVKQELIGYSIYEWDGGNPNRIRAFINIHGDSLSIGIKNEDLDKAIDFSINMSVWPNEGSIQILDDIIIVKLSEVKK